MLYEVITANLVVDVHQADQDGVVTHGGFQLGQADEAIGLGLQIGDLEAIGLQVPAGIQYRRITSYNVCYTKLLRTARLIT